MQKIYFVRAEWDEEAKVWVATSDDVPGLVTEAEEGGFIALNPETGTTTQGETYHEAIHNLKEATSLYLDEFPMKIHSHPVMTTFEVSHA